MILKIELKTDVTNDNLHRIPPLKQIKSAIDKYSEGFKGVVVLHESLYDYRYDTRGNSYTNVDSRQVVGSVMNTEINNDKLYLIIDVNETFDINKKVICFFRSNMQCSPGSKSLIFDELNIFVIDIINIGDTEDVTNERLSEVTML